MKLAFNLDELAAIQAKSRDLQVETCAIGLVTSVGERSLVRALREVPEQAYLERTATRAVLSPSFCIDVANIARAANMAVLFAHTHVGEDADASFSNIDDAGEVKMAGYFNRRVSGRAHFSAVVSGDRVLARQLGTNQIIPVQVVGRYFHDSHNEQEGNFDKYDRQIRAFGRDGQHILNGLKVAIVGLGGTGSVVAQQLAHLGVRNFLLVDPDVVADTNLNRLVGSSAQNIGQQKVEVAQRLISGINAKATCELVCGDVVDEVVAQRLSSVDVIFSCTDSMASRAVLNQFAYQYFIPCFDIGVAIGVKDGTIKYITGRAQLLSPGLPCLVCTNLLDGEKIRREMQSEEQRSKDPYIVGADVAQPAVISLNSTMSSAAVTMFLGAVTKIPSHARFVIYDAMRGTLRPQIQVPRADCVVCSCEGALGRGATWRLPTRTLGKS